MYEAPHVNDKSTLIICGEITDLGVWIHLHTVHILQPDMLHKEGQR